MPSSSCFSDADFVDEASLRATLQLALTPGVGPRIFRALVAQFGSPEAVLRGPVDQLGRVPGVGPRISAQIQQSHMLVDVAREIELCRAHGIRILTEADPHYPNPLRSIPDPPVVLFQQGQWRPTEALAIAIVGTRHPTHYGVRQAERLALGLAQAGLTIVSGVARGIDAAAHRAALRCGGRTIGVLGSGLLNVYPPEHGPLTNQIQHAGALLSELPPRQQPMSGTFPQRNRLISGLSLGVVVVEAAQRSGALITTTHAAEQGREVFAVPGPIDHRTARGCHQLIRDGAKLVETTEDVLDELGPLFESVPGDDARQIRHPAELQLNQQERCILDVVPSEPVDINQVVIKSGLPVQRVLATLSVLEMRHLIQRVGGNRIVRK